MTFIKQKRAILLLVCALAAPVPSTADASDDMFSAMFRMMLLMMNSMSDAMLENNNDAGWGTGDSFGLGMTAWPMMSGMSGISGMNPVNGFGGMPGMSPWSGMTGVPGMSPWSGMTGMPGMSPWSGMSGMPGMSPWSSPMNNNPWANPFTNAYPSNAINPYANRGYGGYTPRQVSLLEGKWYGNAGEILEIRGNRFRLQDGRSSINGAVRIENNIVSLYSPQAGTVTQYTFIRNQTELILQDATGLVLGFSLRSGGGGTYTF
jgi:hypothetical protein